MPIVFVFILVSAQKQYEKLVVTFIEKGTTVVCIGFIVLKQTIASARSCGINFQNSKNTRNVPSLIPHCNGRPVKIKGNEVAIKDQDVAFFTVSPRISFYFLLRMTLSSSVRPGLPSAATRPSGRPASRANQGRNKKISPPVDADSQVRPRRGTAGVGPDYLVPI